MEVYGCGDTEGNRRMSVSRLAGLVGRGSITPQKEYAQLALARFGLAVRRPFSAYPRWEIIPGFANQ
jgi:hypothetical protein